MKIPKFTKEQIEEAVAEYEKEREARIKGYEVFFKSDRFKAVIAQIKEEVKTGPIGDNPYTEPFLFGDVTNDEFIEVFCALGYKEISGLEYQDECGDFSPSFLIYEGLRFTQVHGQGTAFSVRAAE